jgi:hypothetical protein
MVLEQCGIVAAPAEPCGLRFGADIKQTDHDAVEGDGGRLVRRALDLPAPLAPVTSRNMPKRTLRGGL